MSDAGKAALGLNNAELLAKIKQREDYFRDRVLGEGEWPDAELRAYRSRTAQLRLAAVNRRLLSPIQPLYGNLFGTGPRSRY